MPDVVLQAPAELLADAADRAAVMLPVETADASGVSPARVAMAAELVDRVVGELPVYGIVRLPASVHPRLTASAFPERPAR